MSDRATLLIVLAIVAACFLGRSCEPIQADFRLNNIQAIKIEMDAKCTHATDANTLKE